MSQLESSRAALKAAMEVLTAFVGEVDTGQGHTLSGSILMSYAPKPLPADVEDLATLAAMLVMLLDLSVRSQAAFATEARG